ncbi:hypothetical protein [Halosimplex pelagicum]|uniref:Uncharacterized protein n=1 Tax=Halosimplex pelagicum TaxID=869886 RepID=A0A7D5PEJ5_9EURY|nr:hypothetical protein [Halosimplex pelagicum]QLH82140.1 hypothetical protein HZS54_11225 [Halosimplex pelagicum]
MDDSEYTAPNRGVPHPDETPISPYNKQELRDLERTEHKRTLLAFAKKIRTTEAQLKSELRKLGLSRRDNLLDVPINKNQRMVQDPTSLPAARRAETAQSNLRNHYQRWAQVCEQHIQAAKASDTDADKEDSE